MHALPLLTLSLLTAFGGSAMAQYKVVTPDGRVIYTDRQPTADVGKVSEIGGRATAPLPTAGADAGLPFALRQLVSRYPVTLYAGTNCIPCDSARQLLQQRGVPYTERSVLSIEDIAALERLTGGRAIPALMVGSQPLRGFNQTDWASTIDAAGYPKESRLPRGWQPPAVTPLTQKQAPPSAAPSAEQSEPRAPQTAPSLPTATEAAPGSDTPARLRF